MFDISMTFNVFSFFFLSIPICICSSLLIHYLIFFVLLLFLYSFMLIFHLYLFLFVLLAFLFLCVFFSIPFNFSYIKLSFNSSSFFIPFYSSNRISFLIILILVRFLRVSFYFHFSCVFFSLLFPHFFIFTTSISHSSLFYLKLHLSLASYSPLSLTPHFHHYCLPSPSSPFISHSFHSPFHHFS